MSPSGKSLFCFGIYAVCAGLLFIIIPNKIISLTQLPAAPEGWARVVGVLAMVIGTYDILCSLANIKLFIKASVFVRFGFTLGTILLFAFDQMPISIILFGGIEGLSALWTAIALKSEASRML